MKKLFLKAVAFILFSALFFSCAHEHANPASTGSGSIMLEFDNVVGDLQMQLDSSKNTFTNSSGEKFSLTQFNYYISNIRFKKSDGSEYVVPQDSSYFLVLENDPESQEVNIPNIPFGDYQSVTFTIGIDSLRSTAESSKKTGVLSPDYAIENGMYWNSYEAYIFFKADGFSPASPDSIGNTFQYHVGGYGGQNSATLNNIKTITLQLPDGGATVRSNISPEVHMLVDCLKLFSGTNTIRIADSYKEINSALGPKLADNYKSMFMVHHVHNDPK